MHKKIFITISLLFLYLNVKCLGASRLRVARQASDESCSAPNIPNGKFTVRGQQYTPGSPVPNYAVVTFQCNGNFQLSPPIKINTCYDGQWDKEIPQCLSVCPPVESKSVELTCEYNSQSKNCSNPMVEGTIMYMTCKQFFTQFPSSPFTTAVCRNGFWDQHLISCTPECGQRAISPTFIVSGVSAKQGEFPWHVGIYRKTAEDPVPVYNCGGSIISVKVVLTAAHCFTSDADGKLLDISEYSIAAGKYYSDYNSPLDRYSQYRTLAKVEIPSAYKGSLSNFARDISLAIVTEAFEINKVVQPVCVDWDTNFENEQLNSRSTGHLVGWGYTNPEIEKPSVELKYLSLPYIHHDKCIDTVPPLFIKYVTPDKFCAGYTTGASACNGDSGGGIVFEKKETHKSKYYIRGLVSVGPVTEGTCDKNYYGVYTKISIYINFIKRVEALNRDPLTNSNTALLESASCSPPVIENGKFTVLGEGYLPGSQIPKHSLVRLECNNNFVLYPPNGFLACLGDKWDRDIPECKLRTCPPLISSSTVSVSCELDGIKHNCTEQVAENTVAKMTCNVFYTPSNPASSTFTVCKGTSWNNPIIECVRECGQRKGIISLINDGTENTEINFPWHVGFYKKREKIDYICGGTLISDSVILSAAHCFTNNVNGEVLNTSQFFVAAGKLYSDFDAPKDLFAQKRKILTVKVPKTFKSSQLNYIGNIAVIIVDKPFSLTRHIQPACIDWTSKYEAEHLSSGTLGEVAGWGYSHPEDNQPSPVLKELMVPFVPYVQCIATVPQNFVKFVTPDKFCAGYTNGTGLCNGDSGGGLVFKQNKIFFLRGIVSTGASKNGRCDIFQLIAYTKVSTYFDFIRQAQLDAGI